jgi:hypothetical protein
MYGNCTVGRTYLSPSLVALMAVNSVLDHRGSVGVQLPAPAKPLVFDPTVGFANVRQREDLPRRCGIRVIRLSARPLSVRDSAGCALPADRLVCWWCISFLGVSFSVGLVSPGVYLCLLLRVEALFPFPVCRGNVT